MRPQPWYACPLKFPPMLQIFSTQVLNISVLTDSYEEPYFFYAFCPSATSILIPHSELIGQPHYIGLYKGLLKN